MRLCPLCSSEVPSENTVRGNSGRAFGICPLCQLVFRPRRDRPERKVERLRYLSHENSADDEGYVKFLLRPFHWAQNFIEIKGDILDYGCGYAPVFAEQMRQRGYSCDGYDPLFFPEGAHKDQYPEIFCMETVEHFHDTYAEWGKLMNFMSPGGYLIVMTDYWLDLAAFPNWYYQNDLTHTSFYHPSTMEYIAKAFDRELLQTDGKRLALFHYP